MKKYPLKQLYINSNRETHFRPIVDSLKIYAVFFRYVLSSLVTSAVDYLVFSLIFLVWKSLAAATVAGRAVAIFVSFFMQKKFVFQNKAAGIKTFCKLVGLVIISGVCSYGLLKWINQCLGANVFLLKLLVEGTIYMINYLIQKNAIWARRKIDVI